MAASLVFSTAGSWGLQAANVGHSEKQDLTIAIHFYGYVVNLVFRF